MAAGWAAPRAPFGAAATPAASPFGAPAAAAAPFGQAATATPSPFGASAARPAANPFGGAAAARPVAPAAAGFGAAPATGFGAAPAATGFGAAATPAATGFGAAAAAPAAARGFGAAPAATGFGAAPAAGTAAAALPRNPYKDTEVPLGPGSDSISSLAWSSVANHLVVGSWDKKIRAYNVVQDGSGRPAVQDASGAAPGVTPIATCDLGGPVLDVAVHSDGAHVFGASCDKTVAMWNMQTNAKQTVAQHDAPVRSISWLQHYNLLATGGWDAKLRFWDTRTQAPSAEVNVGERVYSLDASKDAGRPLLVVATADRAIHQFDLRKPHSAMRTILSQLRFQTRCVRVWSNGMGYGTGSLEGRLGIRHDVWSAANGEHDKDFTFKCHRVKVRAAQGSQHAVENVYAVNAVATHPASPDAFATAGADGTITMWDKTKRKKLWPAGQGAPSGAHLPIAAMDFNAKGDILAYGCSYDWSRGADGHTMPAENYLYLQHITHAHLNPPAAPGGGGGGGGHRRRGNRRG